MQHSGLDAFLGNARTHLGKGPVAMVFCEDGTGVDTTLRHHLHCGFRPVLAFMPRHVPLAPDLIDKVHRLPFSPSAGPTLPEIVNRVIAAAPGLWMFYCYNAEYLFYPFCETRTVSEMLDFHAGERRNAMLACVVDLYAGDLCRDPDAVSLDRAFLDRAGYYALARRDTHDGNRPKDRQFDIFGGLRWRFEEHIPPDRRRIDRIALFRARKGLHLRGDHSFDDEEYNTISCPWHHNLTAALASFRTAKALKHNPGSGAAIRSFRWHNSVPFEWQSRQLLDLGLMEPGQWF